MIQIPIVKNYGEERFALSYRIDVQHMGVVWEKLVGLSKEPSPGFMDSDVCVFGLNAWIISMKLSC